MQLKSNSIYLTAFFVLLTIHVFANNKRNYYTNIHDIDSLMLIQPKPVVMLIAVDNCNYCIIEDHDMKKTIEKSVNDTAFYYVYFNARSKETLNLGGTTYRYKTVGKGSGVHELASVLTGQYLPTYPTLLVWDKNFKLSYFREGLMHKSAVQKLVQVIQNGNGKVEFDVP